MKHTSDSKNSKLFQYAGEFEDYLQYIGSKPEIICDIEVPSPQKIQKYGFNYKILQRGIQLGIENENSKGKNGLWLEFGVYNGTTINLIAKNIKDREIFGFDSFLGLPEDWRGSLKKGHFSRDGVPPEVESNVTLISGWFNETVPNFVSNNEIDFVSFLHIDCDLYSSTIEVLNNFHNLIKKGTVILFDEFFNYPEWRDHEYRALMEFSNKYDVQFEYIAYGGHFQQVLIQIL